MVNDEIGEIEWEGGGPLATDADIEEFEHVHHVLLTAEHKWFLKNVANGGRPTDDRVIPTEGCPGGAAALHAVYGIGCVEEHFDLSWAIRLRPDRNAKYFPFGSDEVGGDLLINLSSTPGQLVYNPSEPDEFYVSSKSIRDLLDKLKPEEDLDDEN